MVATSGIYLESNGLSEASMKACWWVAVRRIWLAIAVLGTSALIMASARAAPPGTQNTSPVVFRARPAGSLPPIVESASVESRTSILALETAPIDLASALELAGVRNPDLMIARQRVVEAAALRQFAAAQILPNLNAGMNFDTHSGNLQQSNGNILKVSRDALYVGAGANVVGSGTVNIPGLVWNMNFSQAIGTFLVARQSVRTQELTNQAMRNDVLLRVSVAYVELLRAECRRALAQQIRADAAEVARLTAAYAKTGEGRKADADRAATSLRKRENEVLEAEGQLLIASTRLAQLLNLDPSTRLHPIDGWVAPAPIVPDPIPLSELIAVAMMRRPELLAQRSAIREAFLNLRGTQLLPFSPNAIVGLSGGTFGGGSNLIAAPPGSNPNALGESRFGNFASRSDIDLIAFWTLQNLGVGNRALNNVARSRLRSSNLREIVVLNQVRSEVANAYTRTHVRFEQIGTSEEAVLSSMEAFEEDLRRIRGREGLPIEVLDSLRLLEQSRFAYLDAICDYNRAQFELYVALGQPPAEYLARPVPPGLVPTEQQDVPPIPPPELVPLPPQRN